MIDDHETCIEYNTRLFDRNGHTFRLLACRDHGILWINEIQIKNPFEAHLHAIDLMNMNVLEYQIWILDETADDVMLPLVDIWERYEKIKEERK